MIKKFFFLLTSIVLVILIILPGCQRQDAEIETSNQSEETKVISDFLMPAPVLGVVIDSNGKILHVESGSAAESFGLLVGDALISIDGVSIISERDKVRELIRANTEKTEMVLRYQRDDNIVVIQISPSQQPQFSIDQEIKATPTPVLPPDEYL